MSPKASRVWRTLRELAVAVLLAGLATLGYLHYGRDLARGLPIGLFYLLVILASLLGGIRAGAFALALTAGLLWVWPGLFESIDAIGAAIYLLSGAVLVWLVASTRRLRMVTQEQREHLTAVLGGIADGVVAIDEHRRVRYLNAAAERLLGVDRERLQARPIGEVLHGLSEEAFDPSQPPSGARLRVHPRGGEQALTAVVIGLHGAKAAAGGHVLFLRPGDTDLYALSDRRLRAVFDTDMWGICFLDLAGERWLANPGFRRMLPAMPAAPESSSLALDKLGIPAELLDSLRDNGSFDPTEVRGLALGSRDWMLLAGQSLGGDDVALMALDISERKRIDAAFRAQRLLLRSMIDRLPALVAYVDGERRYRLLNRGYARWFPRMPLLDAALDSVHPAAELAPYLPLLDRAFGGEAMRFPTRLQRHGHTRHFDVQLIPHRPDGETVEGVVVHAMDVTERIETDLRLQASERRFRSLGLAWAEIVWYADPNGEMIDAPGWEDLTGQTRRQYRGDGWQNVVDPRDRQRVREEWNEIVRASPAKMGELEFRVGIPFGGSRHVSMRAVPVEDADGEVIEWIGGVRDIHEQRLFEIQLRNAEAEQHALLDNLPKMVWIAEPDGSIRYQNRRWYEYTGLRDAEGWQSITHPDDLDVGVRAWELAIRSGRPLNVELRFRSGSGEYRWHIVRGQPLSDQHGQVRCWYGASTDIEDQKRATQTLAEANQRISRFLAVLSHELRNPLSGVSAASAVLGREDAAPQQRDQALATLNRQNLHLQRMVEDLLEISRVTQGDLALRRETIEVGRLLDEVRSDNLARAEAESVIIDPVRVHGEHYVDGDRARLRQVFDNLLSNAIKASAPGQHIDLCCELDDTHLHIEVRDQGQGLSRDIADKLFEPFVQTPDWRSRGLGLGLNIVKTLIESHGGSVSASSEGLGRGSRFRVRLPALLARPLAPSPPQPIAAEAIARQARHGRILIVDDERDTADALRVLLGLEGHRVETAEDAAAALRWAQTDRFDVVVCDLELPGASSGYDVARALRDGGATPYLIAYSGYGQAEDRERTRQAGFDEHLVKPATLEDLLAAVQRGLGEAIERV